ncbi:hypothetical protein BHE75_01468 [Sphingomonas haloaromaticamans]|uniref:Uncharacterized protein n=1 Tax=Edaphosphingomonas haloaromaticamans TaxID=653954 RepID=A0A1S1HCD2_9SPHN|nr:hypothetical protein BHE75_01468 [Sphingomonas haloaromaticamans]
MQGDQVHPAVAGNGCLHTRPRQRGGNRHGRLVLTHVAGVELRHHQLGKAFALRQRNIVGRKAAALGQAPAADHAAMAQQRAHRLACRNRAEPHSRPRSRAVACARIESAISGGSAAPMSSPAGPAIRASASSPNPCAASRSSRAACVRRDPSAAM